MAKGIRSLLDTVGEALPQVDNTNININLIMMNHCETNCCVDPILAPCFFVIFVLISQFVLVNVVVAVLMKHLEESNKRDADNNDGGEVGTEIVDGEISKQDTDVEDGTTDKDLSINTIKQENYNIETKVEVIEFKRRKSNSDKEELQPLYWNCSSYKDQAMDMNRDLLALSDQNDYNTHFCVIRDRVFTSVFVLPI
uniref:Ion_trans domain-containing protein n=1 Tax=Heterorhabditis bacteriophora TaxID=37862 RepID=A0A1I7XBJ9_HETBA